VCFGRGERLAVFRPYVAGTLGVTTLFFLLTLCFGANPFERLDWTPPDGRGMNPQLQNPGMAIHPPMLYLGYVATTVPFAYAGRRPRHPPARRRLAGAGSAGGRSCRGSSSPAASPSACGGRTSSSGGAGYWAWDPVENASLLPVAHGHRRSSTRS
jgi:cytochrome c-type biogenesis protein CcmF